ncbi:hypothetical protein L1987_44262 [Smallanthus sonchifolius]|uniref:Uncharacterized protein n=1 Tax=Smallanthus sonchifolius TaxID=185202 RepID=A0ACB9GNX8_9ASTR|nr:hypothetical protein L1987_44262 [Smallanthus sonchifolius]
MIDYRLWKLIPVEKSEKQKEMFLFYNFYKYCFLFLLCFFVSIYKYRSDTSIFLYIFNEFNSMTLCLLEQYYIIIQV